MGSPGEVLEPRKPKKVRGEWLRNLEWELACAVTLLDADGKLNSVATEATNGVSDEVAILQAGKLVEGAGLQDTTQGCVVAVRQAKLKVAALRTERDGDGTEELSVALVGREKLRHPVVIVAHSFFIGGFRSHETRGNA
jgi:hypothetical protein